MTSSETISLDRYLQCPAFKGFIAQWIETRRCPFELVDYFLDYDEPFLSEAARWAATYRDRPTYSSLVGLDPLWEGKPYLTDSSCPDIATSKWSGPFPARSNDPKVVYWINDYDREANGLSEEVFKRLTLTYFPSAQEAVVELLKVVAKCVADGIDPNPPYDAW